MNSSTCTGYLKTLKFYEIKPQHCIKCTFFYFYTELMKWKTPNSGLYLPWHNLNLSAFVIKMQVNIDLGWYWSHQFLCCSILKVVRYFAKINHNSEFYTAFIDTKKRYLFPKKDGYSPFSSPWFSLGIYKPAWKKIPQLNAKFVGRFWNRLLSSNLVH